jgi:hypothetical protein
MIGSRFNGRATPILHDCRASAENDSCCINIRVLDQAAIPTSEPRLALSVRFIDGSTGRARLGGEGGIYGRKRPAALFEFVGQFGRKGVPALSQDRPVQAALVAAAKFVEPKAAALRIRMLAELQCRGSVGGTCDELEQAMGLSHQTASARLRELNLKSKIVDSGERRKTRAGRAAIVWFAAEGIR